MGSGLVLPQLRGFRIYMQAKVKCRNVKKKKKTRSKWADRQVIMSNSKLPLHTSNISHISSKEAKSNPKESKYYQIRP
jgi:hypothetical protein